MRNNDCAAARRIGASASGSLTIEVISSSASFE
jgi:hypothetical protein